MPRTSAGSRVAARRGPRDIPPMDEPGALLHDMKAMREYRRMRVKDAPEQVARDAACAKRTPVKVHQRNAV